MKPVPAVNVVDRVIGRLACGDVLKPSHRVAVELQEIWFCLLDPCDGVRCGAVRPHGQDESREVSVFKLWKEFQRLVEWL
jgi:hypothetical protein